MHVSIVPSAVITLLQRRTLDKQLHLHQGIREFGAAMLGRLAKIGEPITICELVTGEHPTTPRSRA